MVIIKKDDSYTKISNEPVGVVFIQDYDIASGLTYDDGKSLGAKEDKFGMLYFQFEIKA